MWKRMTSFAMSLPNRPGELANFMEQLETGGINLIGLWGERTLERIACVPESPAAFRAFFRESGIAIEEGQAFFLSGEDRPGALVRSLRAISMARINVDAIECVASNGRFGCFLWVAEHHWPQLERILSENM
jgi:prephenate dehydratase